MFKILYTGIILHQDTTQDATLDDLGVVNMDSILYCFANSELPFKSLHKISTRHKYYTGWTSVVIFFWIFAEGSDNKLTIGLVPNASYESNQIYPGQVKITDGKFDTVKDIRLRPVFWLADFSLFS